MQAVILAAGQGTRLRPLTNDVPKTMVDLNGQPILWWILSALPSAITEIVIVTGYKGEVIEQEVGGEFQGVPVKYVHQKKLSGTADALWNAKDTLLDEPFLVLHGDNVYDKEDLEQLIALPLALGVFRQLRPSVKLVFDADDQRNITGSHQPLPTELEQPVLVCAGSYILDKNIFATTQVSLSSGELGLPQTVIAFATTQKVRLFEHRTWHEINTLEDLARVRTEL